MGSQESPLACDRSALKAAEWERHRRVTDELMGRVADAERLENGYSLHLPADGPTIQLAAEFVSRERLCCPFLTFTLTVPAGDDGIALELTGPAGTRELLSEALEIE